MTLITTIAMGIAATTTAGVALIHVYWGLGHYWPGRDEKTLASYVIGGDVSMPPRWLTLCIAAALFGLAAVPLVRQRVGEQGLVADVLVAIQYLGCGALALRGAIGFMEPRLRATINPAQPYRRLNLVFYSPLCLVMACALWLSA